MTKFKMSGNGDLHENKYHLEDGPFDHQHTDHYHQENDGGVHSQVHEELAQQQQQHTITTFEILVTPSNLESDHESEEEMNLDKLDSRNSEIVVMNHDLSNIGQNSIDHERNEIVTVSVPMTNGNNLNLTHDSTNYAHSSLNSKVLILNGLNDPSVHTYKIENPCLGQEEAPETQSQENRRGRDLRPRRKPYKKAIVNKKLKVELPHITRKKKLSLKHQQQQLQDSDSQEDEVYDEEPEDDEEEEDDDVEDDTENNNIVKEGVSTASDVNPAGGEVSDSDDGEGSSEIRKCIVCLRQRKFTEAVYDAQRQISYHADVLLAHLSIPVKKTLKSKMPKGALSAGICPECMDQLQRWHIFNSAILKRHETASETNGEKVASEPIPYESFEARVYRNYKKMSKVKEVFLGATHAHYARRKLTEKDWDFFCDHLFHSNSVKSEKSKELERFLMSREKLSHLYCIKCQKLIPNGKKGYTRHVQAEHQETLVLYPCDICGVQFPEKDMTASTEDWYPHWISHFYFNKCDDCGKRFPTKRALGQHRHAVHKNRQVKCEKCNKVLANKMSLDLHLLRHLSDQEKTKYMIKCKVCKKKILNFNMKSHMATHNSERPWKCDHCEATFKMKGALVSHRDVVHFNLKNHVCSICNEAFKSASSLRGHVRRHEGRKDYQCDVCKKEYYTYSALKGHKVVHQTTRNFVCAYPGCNKAFKKKKALEEHGTIHTGERKHVCPICGREIRVKSNLYKHLKIHKKTANEGTIRRRNGAASNNNSNGVVTSNNANSNNNNVAVSTATIVVSSDDPLIVTSNVANLLSENMSSGLVGIEISDQSLLSNNNNAIQNNNAQQQTIQATFLTPHFQTTGNQQATTMVHTLNMQHQHQDLLNVPHYFTHNPPQYFGPLQN